MKLEMECKILVGAESKSFLADLSKLVERMEKAAGIGKAAPGADDNVKPDEEADEDFAPAKTKKAAASFEDDLDETPVEEPIEEPIEEDAPPAKKAKPSFDDEPAEEDKKLAKKGKPAKVTLDDVNDAAMELAARTTRANVLGLLKKHFKIKSVTELKPEQYADFVAVMKKG